MSDLASAISGAARSGPVGVRTGTVTAFDGVSALTVNVGGMTVANSLTGVTTIQGGVELPGVPYLASYAPTVGDPVVLASAGSAWLCLGKVITPPAS